MSPAPPVKVLVVDDLPASRGLAAIWLGDGLRAEVEVFEAASLAEMRAALAAHRPDVVVLDQRLPDGEGLDGARALLAEDPDAAVILLTGMADPALDEEAERIGVMDFLVKHEIDGPVLARSVRYALRRREDRRELRRSEERARHLVSALPDTGVVVVDAGLRFVMAEGDVLERAGWDTEAIVGRDAVEVLHAAGYEEILAGYRAALDGASYDHEATVSATGRTYRTRFRPLGDAAMAVIFDITDQLVQAAELRRAQALAKTGSWHWEAGDDVLTWSPELCRIYGLDPSAPLPGFRAFLTDLVDPLDRDRVLAITRSARGGEPADFEMAIRRTDGARRVLHVRVRPVIGPDGAVAAIDGVGQDVTELRAAQDALRAGEEQVRLVLGNLPRVVVAVYDRELRCTMMEGGTLPGEAYAMLEPALLAALGGRESQLAVAVADGARELEIAVAPHRELHGAICGAMAMARDVTEERAAERARAEAEHRFEIAFDRAPIGMFLAALDGRFLRVNDALTAITGLDRPTLVAQGGLEVVHPDDRATVAALLAGVVDGDVAAEHRIVAADGREVWVAANATLVRDAAGEPLHVLGQMRDVTERREYEARLRHLADHDPLTGLLNRRAFEERLEAHVAHARRYGAAGALMLLDLDGFKAVNDTLGHHAGDELLVAIADALRGRVRETDVLARLGGDEFAVLLPVERAAQAEHLAGALAAVVRERAATPGVTASIGIAEVTAASLTADALLAEADRAMYAAKAAGRDGYARHEPPAARLRVDSAT